MTARDLDDVHAIESAAYAFPWNRGIFSDCLRVGYTCSVLELDGRLAGYSVISAAAREAHLLNLCVSPEMRSRGLGRILLRNAVRSAATLGADRLFLEVRPSNAHALALYRSMGFEAIGRRRNYYRAQCGREDALVLALALVAWAREG